MKRRIYKELSGGLSSSSDSEGDHILEDIFEKFASDGVMKSKGFVKFIRQISGHIQDTLELKIEEGADKALFYFLAEGKTLSFDNFKRWWVREDKFEILSGKKAKLLLKAWDLFSRYSSRGFIDMDNFLDLMMDLQLRGTEDDFDTLDINNDGKVDFREFCEWLRWF